MKTKTYHYGKYTFKSYYKPVGHGWEVGFYHGQKPIFVGNFIHAYEARGWWGVMNREISKFGKKYTSGYEFPVTWFGHFLKSHLYKTYYWYLDKVFARHNRHYEREYAKDYHKYQQMRGRFTTKSKKVFFKAA
jgi:hypothetical protein